MKGRVIHFYANDKTGFITGDDEQRYSFSIEEWKSEVPPKSGLAVDFVAVDGNATQIFSLQKNLVPDELTAAASSFVSVAGTLKDELSSSEGRQKIKTVLKSNFQNKKGFIAVLLFVVSLFFDIAKSIKAHLPENARYISEDSGFRRYDFSFFYYSYSKTVLLLFVVLLALLYLGKSPKLIRWFCSICILGVFFVINGAVTNNEIIFQGKHDLANYSLGTVLIPITFVYMVIKIYFNKLSGELVKGVKNEN